MHGALVQVVKIGISDYGKGYLVAIVAFPYLRDPNTALSFGLTVDTKILHEPKYASQCTKLG